MYTHTHTHTHTHNHTDAHKNYTTQVLLERARKETEEAEAKSQISADKCSAALADTAALQVSFA